MINFQLGSQFNLFPTAVEPRSIGSSQLIPHSVLLAPSFGLDPSAIALFSPAPRSAQESD